MTQPGDVLENRYVVEQVLGTGGSADVYLARDGRLGKRVAIKASRPEAGLDPEQFEREARLLADLDHPSVVPVTDFFEADGRQCLVMAFVEGRDLQTVLDQASGYLDPLQVLQWADEICDALAYLHGRTPPIVVRDLKPSNLMLEASGRLRLIDFGIARRYVAGLDTTRSVRGLGTDGYAAVEQYTGAPTEPRTDIYALGATLYTLLTHVVPPLSVALLSGDANLKPPSVLNPDIDRGIETLLFRMMAVQKADRPRDVREVRAEIRGLIERLTSPPSPASGVVPPGACGGAPPPPGGSTGAPGGVPRADALRTGISPQTPVRPVLPTAPSSPGSSPGWEGWSEPADAARAPLRFLSPVTPIFNGSRETAQQILCRTLDVGLSARLLPDWDPLVRGARWIVIVEHPA